jgi:uncharacterized protein involved in exopolysaccharide biosynthesis
MESLFGPIDLSRYLSALKRRWYLLAAAAVLFAATSLTLGAPVTASADVSLRPNEALVLAGQIQSIDSSLPYRPAKELVDEVVDRPLKKQLKQKYGATISATSTVDSLKVTVSSDKATTSRKVLDLVVSKLRESRVKEAASVASKALAVVADDENEGKKRLADLTKELASLPSSSSSAIGVANERSGVRNSLATIARSRKLLEEALKLKQGNFVVSSIADPTVEKESNKILLPVVFGIFGLLLAACAIVGVAALDGKLRSRTDIERVIGTDHGVLVVPSGQPTVLALAIAGAQKTRPGPTVIIQLGSTDLSMAKELDGAFTAIGNKPNGPVEEVPYGPEALIRTSSAATAFVTVPYARVTSGTLGASMQALVSAGVRIAGVALVDVPDQSQEFASR